MELPSRIVLHTLHMPLRFPFETSFGRVLRQETILVEAVGDGVSGWGEVPASAQPHYSAETVVTAAYVIDSFLAPELFAAGLRTPADCPALFARIRGHAMAKAGLESALWDLEARRRGVPVARLYGGTRREIESGVSLGIEPLPDLMRRIAAFVERGYRRVKLKIKPGWDQLPLAAARKLLPDFPLTADANGAYTLRDAPHLARLDRFRLDYLEQPLGHEDLADHAALAKKIRTPVCLDESITSPDLARNAVDMRACRVVNIKPARVGGPTLALRIHDLCRRRRVPVWCGGLLESGVGRLHNVAIASLPGFTKPGDISGSDRYYDPDVIDEPVVVSGKGTIAVRQGKGIGAEIRMDVLRKRRVSRVVIRNRAPAR
ncbi:MAG: o-succinylbenzoate synthase [Planctomycetes bacterium]|nr:o-succinylbenzoate synthase [Planctomycetota bacterium]